ncbi:MAG: hypothetical protein V3W06_01705 [Acidimicrobiia bacterium]
MTELAGELLFEASAGNICAARVKIRTLAHHLGRLYGETIRACRQYDGLQDEVTTEFMCGMALEPNFGREEELRDSGAEAQEEKTPGQLLYEKQVVECGEDCPPWKLLDCITMENLERDAKAKPDMLRQITAANRTQEIAAEKCDKCQDTGDMGFTMFVKCDGC